MPVLIEMSFGAPLPCLEEGKPSSKVENFLLRSTSTHEDGGLQFEGVGWRVAEQPEPGTDVRGSVAYKFQLYFEQDGQCAGCREYVRFDILEMDRVTPGAAGGAYTVGNVELLCSSCNRIKGERSMEYLLDRRRAQGLLDDSP